MVSVVLLKCCRAHSLAPIRDEQAPFPEWEGALPSAKESLLLTQWLPQLLSFTPQLFSPAAGAKLLAVLLRELTRLAGSLKGLPFNALFGSFPNNYDVSEGIIAIVLYCASGVVKPLNAALRLANSPKGQF